MNTFKLERASQALTLVLMVALVAAIMAGVGAGRTTANRANWPSTGIIGTTNPSGTFTFTTRTGYINTPDGNVVYMWGFSAGNEPFQYPSPVLCVNEGDTVTIVLHNTLPEDVSIIFPGQDNVLANGVPSQPQFDGGGQLTSLAPVAAANGGNVTYSFVASKPGTYLYESGTEPLKQINMGLFGALIVRPAAHPNWAYNETVISGTLTLTTEFNPDTEYLILLSEIDPMLHVAAEQGQIYDLNNYRPRYWLINGRAFPDTVAPNGASWLPSQPYSSLSRVHPYDPVANPYPALVRYINVGTETTPFHPHGNHGRVIARDGRVLIGAGGEDESFEDFTVPVGAGQTWDALWAWTDVEHWDPVSNPIPVTIPQLQNLTFGIYYSGSPYLGNTDVLPVGTQALNQCGEYYHIAHNHALQKVTSWGVVTTGQITFARIDPPLPNNCP
ncbi:MAG: multicopper oxidase domain-containing protein [Chloroflexi bacterium]|nr:multicopper oxidase domain-containing protein [Chloroflexota bacterium]MBU1750555.1 multicopper oxidase domain-containing protein [Chloroflexota bacterium]